MKNKALIFSLVVGFIFLWGTMSANATLFGFTNITNNDAGDAAIGEAQLSVLVTEDAGDVTFLFQNIGDFDSSITDVYFEDSDPRVLPNDFDLDNSDLGVQFSKLAAPPDLPGGNEVDFETTAGLSADSDPPAQPNGVNPDESLGIIFSASLAPIIAALEGGDLRIGIHVQGFASGGSESFVNGGPVPPEFVVPEPATLLLFGVGLIGLAGFRRRFMKK
jgi:hypothetical protein